MEKFTLGNLTMCKMGVQEYNNAYGADAQEQYGENLTELVWMEKYDSNGEITEQSEELMLVFADNTFGFTSRGTVQYCELYYALEVLLWTEKL